MALIARILSSWSDRRCKKL